jgi:hypothetical protein
MSKPITVVLDKKRHLLLDEGVIKVFESKCGNFREYFSENGNLSLWGVMVLLWAMLQREEQDITMEQAAKLVRPNNYAEVFSGIEKCVLCWARESKNQLQYRAR